jgi:pimeloyl-ACP methyl ester carboxylesterase
VTPTSKSEEIRQLIPNSELVVFGESGHWPQLEESEKLQGVVRGFLGKVLTRPGG